MPRPSKRTPEVEETILSGLRQGTPLAIICRDNDDLPHPSRWREWCDNDETLAIAYARAREDGEDAIAAEALEIADDGTNDYVEKKVREGTIVVLDSEHVSRSKLRIETRLKLLAKWNPKRWGEKLDLTTKGDKIEIDADAAVARSAALLASAKKRKDETK